MSQAHHDCKGDVLHVHCEVEKKTVSNILYKLKINKSTLYRIYINNVALGFGTHMLIARYRFCGPDALTAHVL